jgi:hypothetical protein
MAPLSDRKLAANRKNAKKSGGPRSNAGKAKSAQNALRHGLAIPIANIAALRRDVERVALGIARANREKKISDSSRRAAEAELDISRIRKCRVEIWKRYQNMPVTERSYDKLNESLAKLERYERRALSKRNRTLRSMS